MLKKQSQKDILKDNLEEVKILYLFEGYSYAEIAKHFCLSSRNVVAGFLHKMQINKKDGAVTQEQESAICISYSGDGHSVNEISAYYKLKSHNIRKILVKNGVKIRPKKQKPKIQYGKNIKPQSKNNIKPTYTPEPYDPDKFYRSKDNLPKAGYCKFCAGEAPNLVWCKNKATRGNVVGEYGALYCQEHYKKTHDTGIRVPRVRFGSPNNQFLDL